MHADRGYDSHPHRHELRARGIRPLVAKRNTPHGSGLGSQRWFVERTLAWLHQYRRLRTRYERRADIHQCLPRPRLQLHLPPAAAEFIVLDALRKYRER